MLALSSASCEWSLFTNVTSPFLITLEVSHVFFQFFPFGRSIMATSMTKVGGVVVITQVIHQDQASIPLQTSPQATPTSTPVAPPVKRLPPPAPAKLDELSLAFLRGGPQALGVSFSAWGAAADAR